MMIEACESALKRIGRDGVPLLIETLKTNKGNPQVADIVTHTFGEIGSPGAKEALPLLVELLQDDKCSVYAAFALGKIGGPEAKPAIPVLAKCLTDPKAHRGVFAAYGHEARYLANLASVDKAAIEALFKAYDNPDYWGPHFSRSALNTIGKDAVPQLIAILESKSEYRHRAAEVIGRIGTDANEAVPALIKLLEDKTCRSAAALALARIGGPDTKAASPAFANMLNDEDVLVRKAASTALKSNGKDAVPSLIESLKGKGHERPATALALGNLGSDAKATIPALVDLLQDDKCREEAAFALGQIGGTDAKAAVSILVRLLADNDELVQTTVAASLKKLGKRAVPGLIEILKSKSEQRTLAAGALGEIGPDAKAAVPLLVDLLQDEKCREAAALALGRIGGLDAKEAIPILLKLLDDDDELMRMAAATALAKTGKDAVSPLLDFLKGQSSHRFLAAYALGEIGPDAKPAIPLLVDLLDDDDKILRMTAATAVGKFGKDAVPPLIEFVKGAKRNRYLALHALGEIGSDANDALPILHVFLRQAEDTGRAENKSGKRSSERKRRFIFLNPTLLNIRPFDNTLEATSNTKFIAARSLAKIAYSNRKSGAEAKIDFDAAISVLLKAVYTPERRNRDDLYSVERAAISALKSMGKNGVRPFVTERPKTSHR
jgi:HEAT repeat protein